MASAWRLLLLLLLIGAPVRGQEQYLPEPQRALAKRHVPLGFPSTGELIFHDGYIAAHNNWLKIPNWVAYDLPADKVAGNAERARKFAADDTLRPFQRSDPADYKGSGFDQGHMAPAADMKSDDSEMAESFILSNVAPQVGKGFNRGVWKKLEDRVRRWARERGEVWVITGPAIIPDEAEGVMTFKIIGKHRVAVPTHFFKIVYYHRGPEMHVIAFLVPNAPASAKDLPSFITSVSAIEEYTGLDFFNKLDAKLQAEIESQRAPDLEDW